MAPFIVHLHGWQFPCCVMAFVVFAASLPLRPILAQETPLVSSQTTSDEFPDGITPSHVFSRLDLLDRCLDRLIAAKNISVPDLTSVGETRLGPHHVYQMTLTCSHRVQELADKTGVLAMPTLSARPRIYAPRDVRFVVDLMLVSVNRIATELNVEDLPTEEILVSDKTPTDVFGRAVTVLLKLNALSGHDEISPNEVFSEMVRAADDVRSMLQQADPESRYRVDAPPSESGLVPQDVFEKALDVRYLINKHRVALGELEIPVPELPAREIRPRDVLIQSQIILADLNVLKLHTDTISSTPLAITVKSTKLPSDVHEQASLIEYLLRQVNTGADLGQGTPITNQ